MSFQGHIQNGVVIFDEPVSLPEGTTVRVEPMTPATGVGPVDWDTAIQAARELEHYDFKAVGDQRDYDLKHASDHLP